VEANLITANGLGWSPDRSVFYHTDSIRKQIYAYDYDSADSAIANRRVLVDSSLDEGVPDGLAVDSDGCIWSARWDGWKITRYDPAGARMLDIPMPVARPTSCAFGDDDLRTLYITSACHGLSASSRGEHRLAGDLFRIHTEVRGQKEYPFAG
jgi:sugar lactone lactonase YvrE